jgi:hypothetical protein
MNIEMSNLKQWNLVKYSLVELKYCFGFRTVSSEVLFFIRRRRVSLFVLYTLFVL